uniref:Uncharacterized protein n=1 Tax=Leersia perrieri TaxID=77586 RepID=A0A0G2KBI3_9ORYZ
MSGAFFFFWN